MIFHVLSLKAKRGFKLTLSGPSNGTLLTIKAGTVIVFFTALLLAALSLGCDVASGENSDDDDFDDVCYSLVCCGLVLFLVIFVIVKSRSNRHRAYRVPPNGMPSRGGQSDWTSVNTMPPSEYPSTPMRAQPGYSPSSSAYYSGPSTPVQRSIPYQPAQRSMPYQPIQTVPRTAKIFSDSADTTTDANQQLLCQALTGIYDIARDDKNLRALAEQPPGERAKYFDHLRKRYPVRREAHNTTVSLTAPRSSLTAQLKALNFQVAS